MAVKMSVFFWVVTLVDHEDGGGTVSEISVTMCKTMQCHNLEDHSPQYNKSVSCSHEFSLQCVTGMQILIFCSNQEIPHVNDLGQEGSV
jgi:hypothetical protein